MNLKLAKIEIVDLQSRAKTDSAVVTEYSEAWLDGAKFPDVIVFHDGTNYFLADGFHRYFGAKEAGLLDINADVRKGSRKDALWFAIGANQTHGLKRSNADKRRAVELALREKPEMADNAIARHVGVSQPLVSEVRGQLQVLEVDLSKTPIKRIGLDGKARSVPLPRNPVSGPLPRSTPAVAKVTVAIPDPTYDEIGRSIPDALLTLWDRRHELQELWQCVNRVKSVFKGEQGGGDVLFARLDIQGTLNLAEKLAQEIKLGIPYSLCPSCHGKLPEDCTICANTGFVDEFHWKHKVSEEAKTIILKTVKK